MKEKVWVLLVAAILVIPLLAPQVKAGYGPDNPLQPLGGYNPKKSNLAASLEFAFLPTTLGYYEFKDENYFRSRTFKFNATVPNNTKTSYLYLLTSLYDNDGEKWYVKLNNEVLVFGEHSPSAGGNPKGDGKDNVGEFAEDIAVPLFKQVIKIDVTNKLKSGENELSIDGTVFEPGSSKTKPSYSLYGIAVLNFYQTNKTHEIWAYNGIEYFKRKLVTDVQSYAINFEGATYSAVTKASLYVLYHNGNLSNDQLYFNNNLLGDEKAGYAGTDFITLNKFDVASYLKQKDSVSFSTDIGDAYAIYPSLVVLDVEIEDKTPPSISITAPKNNSNFLSNESINVSYTVDEEVSETYVKIGTRTEIPSKVGAAYQAKINLSSSGIGNGTKEILIVAKDLANNEAKKSITINISTPTVIKTVDIGIGNITVDEGYEVEEGKEIHVSVDGINKGLESAEAEVSLYLDNASIDSQKISLDSLGHRKVDFAVNGTKITKGTREIKAAIKHMAAGFRDNETGNDEKSISIAVKEKQIALPPVEKPAAKDIDIGISSLTIEEGYEVKEGKDVRLNVVGINKGGDSAEAEVSIYIGDILIDSQKTTLDAYGHKRVDFAVKGIRLEKGIREIKAKIKHISEGVRDPESTDNEKALTIVVVEEKTMFSKAIGIGKWVAGILVGVILLKLIIDFISERTREDYLK